MNATHRAFDMVDGMTGKGLSAVFLGSLVPELAQDFASFVEDSGKYI